MSKPAKASDGGLPTSQAKPIKQDSQATKQLRKRIDAGRKRAARTKPRTIRRTLQAIIAAVLTLYLLTLSLFICPRNPSYAPETCAAFDKVLHYRSQAIDYAHPHFQPYQKAVEPYYAHVRPHITKASNARSKAGLYFDKKVVPRVIKAYQRLEKLAQPKFAKLQKQVDPHYRRYHKLSTDLYRDNLAEHVNTAQRHYHNTLKTIDDTFKPYYTKLEPYAVNAYPASRKFLVNTAYPSAVRTYDTTKRHYLTHAHPRILYAASQSSHFARNKVLPFFLRYHSLYIRPQLAKIGDKVWEYKARRQVEAAVANSTAHQEKLKEEAEIDDIDALIKELREEETQVAINETAEVESVEAEIKVEDKIRQKVKDRREDVEKWCAAAEAELPVLGKKEAELLATRLSEIRQEAFDDQRDRFTPKIKELRDEADKWEKRVGKYWDRVKVDERASAEEKIHDGLLIARKASTKVTDLADDMIDEIDEYGRAHWRREQSLVDKAYDVVTDHIAQAQEHIGWALAYEVNDTSYNDWQRFHQLKRDGQKWKDAFQKIVNGTQAHSALTLQHDAYEPLNSYKEEVERIVNTFEDEVERLQLIGEKRAEGKFVSLSESAEEVYEKVSNKIDDAKEAIASAAGYETKPTPSNVRESVASYFSVASEAVNEAIDHVSEGVEEYAAQISQGAVRAVGGTPDPTNLSQTLSSVIAQATDVPASAVSNAYESVASVMGDISQVVVAAVGGEPTPTNVQESASSLAQAAYNAIPSVDLSGASSVVQSAYDSIPTIDIAAASSQLSQAAAQASSAGDQAYSSAIKNVQDSVKKAKEAVGVEPSPEGVYEHVASAIKHGSESASSHLHEATRAAAKAIGVDVPAEGLSESASSVASVASSKASSIASVASSQAQQAYEDATNIANSKSISSMASQVTAAVNSAASQASGAAAPIISSASSVAQQAYQDAQKAVGMEPQPEGILESASSVIHEATRSVQKAVGGSPTPESVKEHMEDVLEKAQEKIAHAVGRDEL